MSEQPERYTNDMIEIGYVTHPTIPDEVMRAIRVIQFWLIDVCDVKYGDAGTMDVNISLNDVEFSHVSSIDLPLFNQVREEASQEGYVYLIHADNGLYKIGKSNNLDKRIHNFGVKLPVKTELVHAFQSAEYSMAERVLHKRYAKQRSHGEWFVLTDAQVAEICAIQDGEL